MAGGTEGVCRTVMSVAALWFPAGSIAVNDSVSSTLPAMLVLKVPSLATEAVACAAWVRLVMETVSNASTEATNP